MLSHRFSWSAISSLITLCNLRIFCGSALWGGATFSIVFPFSCYFLPSLWLWPLKHSFAFISSFWILRYLSLRAPTFLPLIHLFNLISSKLFPSTLSSTRVLGSNEVQCFFVLYSNSIGLSSSSTDDTCLLLHPPFYPSYVKMKCNFLITFSIGFERHQSFVSVSLFPSALNTIRVLFPYQFCRGCHSVRGSILTKNKINNK